MTNVTALDPALNEIKFKSPQQDIQQLGTALAIELNMVMAPCREETNCSALHLPLCMSVMRHQFNT